MPRSKSRLLQLIVFCLLTIGMAGCTTFPGYTMDYDLDTSDWQTHCLGRYLVELPPTATVSARYEYASGDVKTTFPVSERQFLQIIDDHVTKLKNTENTKGGSQFVDITRFDDHSVLITSWYSPTGGKISYKSELFVWRTADEESGLYHFTAETDPTKQKITEDFSREQAQTIRYRKRMHVPQGPGFCINHGFIASDRPNFEKVDAYIEFPNKPGLSLNIVAYVTAHPPEKTMFEREASISLPAKFMRVLSLANRLRHDLRTVNGMPGQEIMYSHEADNGIEYYLANWQTPGEASSMRHQRVRIELHTSKNHVEHALFDSHGEALAFWDAIVGSFRMRAGAAGNAR